VHKNTKSCQNICYKDWK